MTVQCSALVHGFVFSLTVMFFFLVVFRYDLITQYWYTVVLPPFQSNRSIEYTRTSIISDTSEEYNALCYMHLLPSRGTEKISHRASSKEKV